MSEEPEHQTEDDDDRRVYGRRAPRRAPGTGPLAAMRQVVLASLLIIGAVGIYLSTYDLAFALAIVGYALGRVGRYAQHYIEDDTRRLWVGRITNGVMLVSAIVMLYRAASILGFAYS